MQQEFKDGALNPHFVDGFRRTLYGILHDINPMGQTAQLSAMKYFHPIRWIACDVFWLSAAVILGNAAFQRKDIR